MADLIEKDIEFTNDRIEKILDIWEEEVREASVEDIKNDFLIFDLNPYTINKIRKNINIIFKEARKKILNILKNIISDEIVRKMLVDYKKVIKEILKKEIEEFITIKKNKENYSEEEYKNLIKKYDSENVEFYSSIIDILPIKRIEKIEKKADEEVNKYIVKLLREF